MELTEIESKLSDVVKTCYNIESINKYIKVCPEKLVEVGERIVQDQLDKVVNNILNGDYKFLLISGPSSSGKTTTAHQIANKLKAKGKKAIKVSLDDFFIDLDKMPKQPDGTVDLETINKVDLVRFNKFFKEIMTKNKAHKPVFNFVKNKREDVEEIIETNPDDLIIVEGTHALNPELLNAGKYANKILKVYVCVNSDFSLGKEIAINSRKIRLIRRLIRDLQTRGKSAEETINYWNIVCRGEDKYVAPYKSAADFIIDTTHLYELSIYDKIMPKILKPLSHLEYAKELLEVFNKAGSLSKSYIPDTSMLWEFLVEKENR